MARSVGLLMILLASCAGAQEVRGTVFEVSDAGRAPAANAYVVVHWTGYRPGFGHYESVCLQAAIGRTDAAGRFAVPEPPMRPRFVLFHSDPAVAVYKPGFEAQSGPRREAEWVLVPTRMTPEQRAVYVDIFRGYGCREDDGALAPLVDPQGVLADFNRELAAEASRSR